MRALGDKFEAHFWSRIDQSGGPDSCWLWTGACDEGGYGITAARALFGKGPHRSHRIAYQLHHGVRLRKDQLTLHDCPGGDNPRCCNPRHLYAGTHADNGRDRKEKKQCRPCRGENNGRAKLTWDEVCTVRWLRSLGRPFGQVLLGRIFGVSPTLIGLIIRGKIWRTRPS